MRPGAWYWYLSASDTNGGEVVVKRERIEVAALIAEVIGAVAVVISVVYLAFEISDSTREMRNQSHFNALSMGQRPVEILLADSDLAAIVEQGYRDPDALSAADRHRFMMYELMEINAWEYYFYADREGVISRNLWVGADSYYRSLGRNNPGTRQYWDEYRHIYDEPFATYADGFLAADADAQHFGPPDEQLFWTREQKIAGFRNMDRITWSRAVPAGDKPFPLARAERSLDDVVIASGERRMTLDEYVGVHDVAGLIVVKDGAIVYERYALGNTPTSRWLSYSVAKSVTSLLVGAAIRDGYIHSVDDAVTDYLPLLRGSAYDGVTIRNLLQMSSGIAWDEDYADREADINRVPWDTLSLYRYVAELPRAGEPGLTFNYNTAETNLVGTLLRSAVGNNLSTYLGEKIWKPFGMEHDAYWILSEPGGGEFGGSSLNATLRDYARIGLFALRDGELPNGERALPDGWMADSTTPSSGYTGYGYLWWLRARGVFVASGIFGQSIYIDPGNDLVIAQHSARDAASEPADWALQYAAFEAISAALSGDR